MESLPVEIKHSQPCLERLCFKHCLVPIDKIGKSLTLAMSNPLNFKAIEEVENVTGCSVQVFVSTTTEIKQYLDKVYNTQ